MKPEKWEKFKTELSLWRGAALPGILVIIGVILLRLIGGLQPLELIMLDTLLKLRPTEPKDERIVIIGIDEKDIQKIGIYPIPDQELAQLLTTLEQYQPKVIGVDIVRDLPVEPGHHQLVKVFENSDQIIGGDKVLGANKIAPPPVLKNKNQVGFVDVPIDNDGNYRRILLGSPTDNEYRFSFPLMLAEKYLEKEGFTLENGKIDQVAMAFKNNNTAQFKELNRFLTNTGGYVNADDGGVQMLINFRQNQEPFIKLSLSDIKDKNFNPNLIKDKIVLIGITSPSIKDLINNNAVIDQEITGQIYGVEILAHGTSQIISYVKDGRSLLRSWSEEWEYLWILGWGIILICISRFIQKPLNIVLFLGVMTIFQIGISYILLIIGFWIPLMPILLLNLIGLFSYLFYKYDLALRTRIDLKEYEIMIKEKELTARQNAIDDFYEEIHRSALQNLALLMRDIEQKITIVNAKEELMCRLKQIDKEIRQAYQEIEKLTLSFHHNNKENKSKTSLSITELLNNTYEETINTYSLNNLALIVGFETIEENDLTPDIQRNLCLFIEEMLCNINKHAHGVKRIIVEGKKEQNFYTLKIEDNGIGITDEGLIRLKNKKLIKRLEKQLKGKFTVNRLPKRGTLCEFSWQLKFKN